jgi:hypothetical protein
LFYSGLLPALNIAQYLLFKVRDFFRGEGVRLRDDWDDVDFVVESETETIFGSPIKQEQTMALKKRGRIRPKNRVAVFSTNHCFAMLVKRENRELGFLFRVCTSQPVVRPTTQS